MTWDPTFDSGSHLIACESVVLGLQSLSFVSGCHGTPPHPTSSKAPILNDAFSKPHICDRLYCAFPRNHLGASGDWEGGGVQGSHQSLSDARHFPIDLFKHSPCLQQTFAVQPIQEPKYFPPNCCWCWCAHLGSQYVPMKRQNLSKTLKVAKKSISSHKLFIIIVTSTIHYATENNCKEISQDRMHTIMSGRLPNWTICQIVFFSFCRKLKWDPPCRFLVFQVEPKIYYFTDPDTTT